MDGFVHVFSRNKTYASVGDPALSIQYVWRVLGILVAG